MQYDCKVSFFADDKSSHFLIKISRWHVITYSFCCILVVADLDISRHILCIDTSKIVTPNMEKE
jgi:hypothetical protein